jgi:hypothetical protein
MWITSSAVAELTPLPVNWFARASCVTWIAYAPAAAPPVRVAETCESSLDEVDWTSAQVIGSVSAC